MSLNNPTIPNYKPFYIQKGGNCYDTKEQWGMVAKSNPFPALPTPKTPYSNNWKDENGDDEYLDSMAYQSFEFDVQFYIRTRGANSAAEIRTKMNELFQFIREGELLVFDSYTSLGRKKVRYAGFKEDSFVSRGIGSDSWARCIFTITFKVNDPVTFVTYDNASHTLK